MKIECPVCCREGYAQVRGKNVMIQHYQGFECGKRIYQYHKVPYAQFQELQVNASKKSASKEPENSGVLVRRVGFEPTNPYGIGASGLRL
jgi:hypothetical protein